MGFYDELLKGALAEQKQRNSALDYGKEAALQPLQALVTGAIAKPSLANKLSNLELGTQKNVDSINDILLKNASENYLSSLDPTAPDYADTLKAFAKANQGNQISNVFSNLAKQEYGNKAIQQSLLGSEELANSLKNLGIKVDNVSYDGKGNVIINNANGNYAVPIEHIQSIINPTKYNPSNDNAVRRQQMTIEANKENQASLAEKARELANINYQHQLGLKAYDRGNQLEDFGRYESLTGINKPNSTPNPLTQGINKPLPETGNSQNQTPQTPQTPQTASLDINRMNALMELSQKGLINSKDNPNEIKELRNYYDTIAKNNADEVKQNEANIEHNKRVESATITPEEVNRLNDLTLKNAHVKLTENEKKEYELLIEKKKLYSEKTRRADLGNLR